LKKDFDVKHNTYYTLKSKDVNDTALKHLQGVIKGELVTKRKYSWHLKLNIVIKISSNQKMIMEQKRAKEGKEKQIVNTLTSIHPSEVQWGATYPCHVNSLVL